MARSIVKKVEPEQADEVVIVAEKYRRAAARRARRPSDEPTASVTDVGQTVLAAVALGMTTDICEYLLIAGAKKAAKSSKDWLRRQFGKKKIIPETEVPQLSDEQRELIRQQAVAAAVKQGLAAEQAKELAEALVDSWPRSK